MTRTLSVNNLYSKKFKTFPFEGIFKEVFGEPTKNGIWLIYGKEKNGKTWGTLKIAEYLSEFEQVLYISAEEGTDMEFQSACKRANLNPNNKRLKFLEYEPLEDLYVRLRKKKSARIVVLDNLTVYNDEIKGSGIKKLKQDFPNHLFIMVAHEERNEPYTAAAKMARKYCKVYIQVKGLTMICGGRIPGGNLLIDEEKAVLYHGEQIKQ